MGVLITARGNSSGSWNWCCVRGECSARGCLKPALKNRDLFDPPHAPPPPQVQANDKEALLARFVTVERALKDAIQQQLSAERALDGKVAAHTAALTKLVQRTEERARGAEDVLRDQVEAAMGRLRTYAREVEESLDQVCTVVISCVELFN